MIELGIVIIAGLVLGIIGIFLFMLLASFVDESIFYHKRIPHHTSYTIEHVDDYCLSFRECLIVQYIDKHERKPPFAKWGELERLTHYDIVKQDRYDLTWFGHSCLQSARLMYSTKIARKKHKHYWASQVIL